MKNIRKGVILIALIMLVSLAVLRLLNSDHVILEGNRQGTSDAYVQWLVKRSDVMTCFISKGPTKVVSGQSSADAPASFSYYNFRFEMAGNNMIVRDALSGNTELFPVTRFIFYLGKGGYMKIPQNEIIREKMKRDYECHGDEIYQYLISQSLIE